jgi:hypothetical protein
MDPVRWLRNVIFLKNDISSYPNLTAGSDILVIAQVDQVFPTLVIRKFCRHLIFSEKKQKFVTI